MVVVVVVKVVWVRIVELVKIKVEMVLEEPVVEQRCRHVADLTIEEYNLNCDHATNLEEVKDAHGPTQLHDTARADVAREQQEKREDMDPKADVHGVLQFDLLTAPGV